MSRRRGRAVEEEKSEIDLTPMLDVVFIMLIFFIVTASFVKEKALDVTTPDPNEQTMEQTESKNILFTVTASDEIMLVDRRIDTRAVRANIARLHAENPEAIVIVRAHRKSSAATYVAIADAAREVKDGMQVSLVPYED